ncbi:acetylcholinesterase-1-like [Ornithodoros turicata]|uniref:acetylcholinesterase-1-like n=1 Tax=Ornithodoros turicata TaxID=34597 RepID=UPI003139E432
MGFRWIVVMLHFAMGSISNDTVDFVVTKIAAVHGVTEEHLGVKIKAYLGVPYAEAPLEDLRFRKPVPVKQKDRMILATRMKDSCMQQSNGLEQLPWLSVEGSKSENCLYLNIWTPQCANVSCPLRPVLFWIHAGAFRGGSASMDIYNGGMLAAYGDVVTVTFNYRLGAFGFLSLNDSEVPGNMGLYDQQMALKWIYENIRYFGGNPKQITIFGHDAGALSVGLHLTSPMSRKFIRRAALLGGAPNWLVDPLDHTAGFKKGLMLSKAVQCSDVSNSVSSDAQMISKCLKEADAMTIVNAESEVFSGSYYTFWPRDKDELVPMDPVLAVAKGHVLPVDVFVGVAANEGFAQSLALQRRIFDPQDGRKPTREEGIQILNDALYLFSPKSRERIIDFYFENNTDVDGDDVRNSLALAFGDIFVNCPVTFLAESFGDRPMNAYYYVLTHRPSFSKWPEWYGVTHFDDVTFLFGMPLRYPDMYSANDATISRVLMNAITSFATSGRPSPMEGMLWPKFTSRSPEYLELNPKGITLRSNPFKRCDFWRTFYPKIA